jgi:hypothetical protein
MQVVHVLNVLYRELMQGLVQYIGLAYFHLLCQYLYYFFVAR